MFWPNPYSYEFILLQTESSIANLHENIVSINNVVKFEVLRTQPFLFNILGANTSQLSQKPTEQMIFYKEFKCLLSIQIKNYQQRMKANYRGSWNTQKFERNMRL